MNLWWWVKTHLFYLHLLRYRHYHRLNRQQLVAELSLLLLKRNQSLHTIQMTVPYALSHVSTKEATSLVRQCVMLLLSEMTRFISVSTRTRASVFIWIMTVIKDAHTRSRLMQSTCSVKRKILTSRKMQALEYLWVNLNMYSGNQREPRQNLRSKSGERRMIDRHHPSQGRWFVIALWLNRAQISSNVVSPPHGLQISVYLIMLYDVVSLAHVHRQELMRRKAPRI